MNTTTKRTDELAPGDVIVLPEIDSRSYVLPISDEHPGTRATVVNVEPWMLTAGPRAGQQAREGRGNKGAPLFVVNLDASAGQSPCATADKPWTLA